jgi:glycolate oxidase FAD binding subunit
MSAQLSPASVRELVELVRSTPKVQVVGNGTKPRLAQSDAGIQRFSTTGLSGIVEYEPEEFTVTALAGTPVRELANVLAKHGQYLPFDPMFAQSGATLGGTVAAGTSGPGRFRFGGVRDFILGARFVDGLGRLLRVGGKVVKNAAGFDVPKLLVGSLGRLGVITEVTLKIFPQPAATLSLKLHADSADAAAMMLGGISLGRWEPQAIDIAPGAQHVLVRLAGPASALPALAKEILTRWPGAELSASQADSFWTELGECQWAHSAGVLLKVPITMNQVTAVLEATSLIPDAGVHISAGGNVAFVSLASPGQVASLSGTFQKLGVTALTLRGSAPLWLGVRRPAQVESAVKHALDPDGRFPGLDD